VRIELRHMRYAIAAADYRSLRRAAEALHLKQSTLSRCIRELEDELSVLLFERSRAGVRTTEAGMTFITSARRVVQEIDSIRDQAVADAERTTAAVERLGPAITPESLRTFVLAARRKLRKEDGTYRRDHLRPWLSASRSSIEARSG
jgi:DNA-binding transcriptional LysR family regulator